MSDSDGPAKISSLLHEPTPEDLDSAWREREDEGVALGTNGNYSMGTALRLYALEIRLKVKICRHLKLKALPKACKTHDLAELLIFTGLSSDLAEPANAEIWRNWDLLATFSKKQLKELRCNPKSRLALVDLMRLKYALDDEEDGVLAWLSRHP